MDEPTDEVPMVLDAPAPAPEYDLKVLDSPTEEELEELERRVHEEPGEGILNRDAAATEAKGREEVKSEGRPSEDPRYVAEVEERKANQARFEEISARTTAVNIAAIIAPKTGNVASLLKNADSIVEWLRDGTQP